MSDPSSTSNHRLRRSAFLGLSGLVAATVIVASRQVILPFVLALVIAYVLTPLVAWVESRRLPRAGAIVLVYLVVLGSMWLFLRVAAPRVGQELKALRREVPRLVSTAKDQWGPAIQDKMRGAGLLPPALPQADSPGGDTAADQESSAIVVRPRPDGSFAVDVGSGVLIAPTGNGRYLVEPVREAKEEPFDPNRIMADAVGKSFAYAQHNALELARIGRDIVAGVSRFIFIFGITLMLAAYMMLTRERIIGFFRSLVRPTKREDFERLLARIDRGLSGVVRGQLIICLVNGVLSAIGFAAIGLKYWPVLALVATVFSLVPIFGSIASAVPAVALGLTQSFGTAVFVLLWILGIHQLEANFLNPKIMGDAAKIHPVLVIFSLLVGEHFFHTIGALLAVPCMSIAQSLFVHIRARIEAADPEFDGEPKGSIPPPRMS